MNVAEFCESKPKPAPIAGMVSDCEDSALKIEINNIIWMFSPESLTLKEADELSITIMDLVKTGGKNRVTAEGFRKFTEMKAAVAAEEAKTLGKCSKQHCDNPATQEGYVGPLKVRSCSEHAAELE